MCVGKTPSDELLVLLPVLFLDFVDFVDQVAELLGELVVLFFFGDLVQFLGLGLEFTDVVEPAIFGKNCGRLLGPLDRRRSLALALGT